MNRPETLHCGGRRSICLDLAIFEGSVPENVRSELQESDTWGIGGAEGAEERGRSGTEVGSFRDEERATNRAPDLAPT